MYGSLTAGSRLVSSMFRIHFIWNIVFKLSVNLDLLC
jgi:hypothetical protein